LRVFFNFLHVIVNDVINVIDNNPSGAGNFLTTSVAFDASRVVTSALLGIGFYFGNRRSSAKELR
jgi:hypothetical protein